MRGGRRFRVGRGPAPRFRRGRLRFRMAAVPARTTSRRVSPYQRPMPSSWRRTSPTVVGRGWRASSGVGGGGSTAALSPCVGHHVARVLGGDGPERPLHARAARHKPRPGRRWPLRFQGRSHGVAGNVCWAAGRPEPVPPRAEEGVERAVDMFGWPVLLTLASMPNCCWRKARRALARRAPERERGRAFVPGGAPGGVLGMGLNPFRGRRRGRCTGPRTPRWAGRR